MVAIPVLVLLHTPPGDDSLKVEVAPTHIEATPEIGAGTGSITTLVVAKATQPVPGAVTTTVYVPDIGTDAGDSIVFCVVALKLRGPLQV